MHNSELSENQKQKENHKSGQKKIEYALKGTKVRLTAGFSTSTMDA